MTAQFRLPADAHARLGAAALLVATALDCSVAEAVGWVEESAARLRPLPREAPERYAARLLKVRSMRAELLGAAIFQDLAWDMLLDLYVREAEGRRVSITSLTIASGGAPTTALRHLDKLLSHGLVTRTADAEDGRRSWIGLTPATRAAITELMERLYELG